MLRAAFGPATPGSPRTPPDLHKRAIQQTASSSKPLSSMTLIAGLCYTSAVALLMTAPVHRP
jgi:hypothetical protein